MCLISAFLPVTAGAQGRQRLRYQSSHKTLAAAQDVSEKDAEMNSERQERDRAVGMTGLFFIVVVIAIGVLFAIIMVAGYGGRKSA
jgi:hypothetical protein